MDHEIEINGCMIVPEDAKFDEVIDKFIELTESCGQYFGGTFGEIRDGYYVKADGTLGNKAK